MASEPQKPNPGANIEEIPRAMAIVDDYAAISAEIRRIQAERSPPTEPADAESNKPSWRHPMRATLTGDLLYRRLVSQRARRR
jgi:hypothetical protein